MSVYRVGSEIIRNFGLFGKNISREADMQNIKLSEKCYLVSHIVKFSFFHYSRIFFIA